MKIFRLHGLKCFHFVANMNKINYCKIMTGQDIAILVVAFILPFLPCIICKYNN